MPVEPPGWTRSPGAGPYARPERERRFLVPVPPPSTAPLRVVVDHYVTATTLRLRHVRVGTESVYKLTQKVRVGQACDPAEVSVTNVYLTAVEHERLSSLLPGRTLTKSRSVHRTPTHQLAVDVFHGPLTGLILAEVEVQELDEALALPYWAGPEVTHDDRFSGGNLARATPQEIDDVLTVASRRA